MHVVYGTSKDPFRRGLDHFTVANMVDMDICNLKCATRFVLSRHTQLPWGPDYFSPYDGLNTPVIGHLTQHLQKLLQVQVSYWQNSQR